MGGMGGMGSMYGSSYGLGSMYGSGMGGYGMGGYGMNGMGMGMNGMGMNGMDGAGGIAQGTQATFQLIESVIGAVGGFAQMLEATYMATHSSFFTMISVAEQFGHLKQALGGLFGIFALMKYMKKIIAKLSGRKFDYGLSPSEFTKFDAKQKKLEDKQRKKESGPNRPRISLKPLLFFLAAVFGFPYLINKIIKRIGEQQQQQLQALGAVANPALLQFGKALYAFNPENPQVEAALVPGDLVAILTRLDPQGKESPWWRVRKRDGSMGYVPGNYLEIIERKTPALTAPVNDAAVRAQEKQNAFDVNEFKKV
ncbi:hypothetical protein BABINDRAFT_159255 [Babjeviella inositovora NRRL Y-12698]|uniref:Peroxisomal membrane protein PEX13 n=1 Tax=Babjeviella inositovora NRRL Y-12698 TaxID=984486 RepID=A0A1E3QYM7_9ASCO|nr:uncharacterized protein BABINDRAFT_159255 [Babjeviella inositovora NRRL Y-12698]ODQ82738.1 hypothetical protein BABINDRAFT_159255 [Babjeviella inositovora NRRL Y-12698]